MNIIQALQLINIKPDRSAFEVSNDVEFILLQYS